MCGDVIVRANRYLHKSTISAIKLCSHVNSLSMELGILTSKIRGSLSSLFSCKE